jgi:hypothetical protein
MLVPVSTLGTTATVFVRAKKLSAIVVLPEEPWPHKTILRMESTLFFPMNQPLRQCGVRSIKKARAVECLGGQYAKRDHTRASAVGFRPQYGTVDLDWQVAKIAANVRPLS